MVKKNSREQPDEQILKLADNAVTDSPIAQILKNERNQAIIQAVRSLDYRQRTVVILFYYNELGTREIASVMECMEGTVKSRLFHARKNLRSVLNKDIIK